MVEYCTTCLMLKTSSFETSIRDSGQQNLFDDTTPICKSCLARQPTRAALKDRQLEVPTDSCPNPLLPHDLPRKGNVTILTKEGISSPFRHAESCLSDSVRRREL